MLDAFQAHGQFYKGNLHGHSNVSDAALSPEDACKAYREAGYDFTAITDHFREKFGFPIVDTCPWRTDGFTTLIGAELHAPMTSRGQEWHILAVGLPFDFAPPRPNETGPELARRARAAGAFVAIPHPHWFQLTLEDARALDAAHAVEVYNHTSQVNADRGDGLVFYDAALSDGLRLAAIAVDDSHWRIADAFGGWVMVKATENSPEALLGALKAGHFYASQGPEIIALHRDGQNLHLKCSPASSAILVGAGSRNVRVHGDGLTEAVLPLDAFEMSWCRLIVVDDQGRRAWSNPLWLDQPFPTEPR